MGWRSRISSIIRKQGMQLASKMRFLAVQFIALLDGRSLAAQCRPRQRDGAAARGGVRGLPRVRLTQPVEANGVFALIPSDCIAPLQERRLFQVWNPQTSEVRWMTAWDTTEDDVDRFAAAIREVVG